MIRDMKPADISRVAEIHVFGQRKAYMGVVSNERLFSKTTVKNRAEEFARDFEKGLWAGYVYDDGITKGFLMVGHCDDADKVNSLELHKIFTDPLMTNQGIGTRLIKYCEQLATQQGFDQVCLWVLKDNTAARGFYKKMGYGFDGSVRFMESLGVDQVRYTKKVSQK